MEPERERTPSTYAAFSVCCAIWGSTFLFIRIGNESLAPYWAVTLRLAAAAVLLAAIARVAGQPFPRGAALRAAAGYGVFGFGISLALLYWGETEVQSAIAALLYATIPLSTALIARAFGLERLRPAKVAAALVALAGVAAIFSGRLGEEAPLLPMAALLIAATSASLSSVILKRGPHQPALAANAVAAAVGAAVTFGLSLAAREPMVVPTTFAQLYPLVYLTLAGSVVAYVLMSWLVQRWPATSVSLIAVVIPLVALVLGAAVRGERLAGPSWIGGGLILAGVIMGLRADREPAPHRVAAGRARRQG